MLFKDVGRGMLAVSIAQLHSGPGVFTRPDLGLLR